MCSTPALAYIPAPGSPTGQSGADRGSDSEEDPLDAFMAGIEQQVQQESAAPPAAAGFRGDIEEEDVEESYYRSVPRHASPRHVTQPKLILNKLHT